MMWFRRPEFDRYARYHSHGSAREVFGWEEMCDVRLPIPPLSLQREIVAEYETLTRRIRLNERLISTLESAAQTLYRRTFVDNIDPAHLPLLAHRNAGGNGRDCGRCNSFNECFRILDRERDSVDIPCGYFKAKKDIY